MPSKLFDLADYRIDYIRLRLAQDIGEKMAQQKYWIETAENVCKMYSLPMDCFKVGTYYDKYTRKSMYYFEMWGKACVGVYEYLQTSDFNHVMRLDIRKELEDTHIDFDGLFQFAKRRNKSRSTVKDYSSPFRSKVGGRNAGGETLQIGGDQSQQKLCIYKRGKERPAAELQLEGDALRKLLSEARSQPLGDYAHVRDNIKEALVIELEEKVMERVGYAIDEIEEGLNWSQLTFEIMPVEDQVQQLEMNFWSMPTEAQEGFLEAVTGKFETYVPTSDNVVDFQVIADLMDERIDSQLEEEGGPQFMENPDKN